MKRCVSAILIVSGCFLSLSVVKAQINDLVFKKDYKINPNNKGELYIELDNISFFKDNEFMGNTQEGYTLPGLWVQPKAVFYPLKNIKLEAGLHLLKYWGADRYPCFAYKDIARWKGDQYQRGFHLLPFFRAQIALSKNVDLILGNIYGGANHNLIEPLYNPEMNLTADPEAGLQLLYNSRFVDLDAWVNWESFIFNGDTHQEAFTFGVSTQVKFNNPESKFHFYIPLQTMIQHRGGEIDTIHSNSVQTWINAASGAGVTYNINCGVLKRINFEMTAAVFAQQAGEILPFKNGYGFYPKLTVDIYDFRIQGGYWKCKDFVSLFGNPFFGAISTTHEGKTFDSPSMVYLKAEYSRSFGKGFSLGIDVDVFNQNGVNAILPQQGPVFEPSALSFSAGVYFRINPSFLIKKF